MLGNTKVSEEDLNDLLEDILDQEFDTICEDESTKEVSRILLKYLELINSGQVEVIKSELSKLPPCNSWIVKGSKINIIRDAESSSSDESDEEMDTYNAPQQNHSVPSTSGSTMRVQEEDLDPGWTVVKKGKRRN